MKKCFLILLLLFLVSLSAYAKRLKEKAVLTLSNSIEALLDSNAEGNNYFRVNDRIYFHINNPNGFSSDYIKYQVVKQEDNAHVIGYTRLINKTCRLRNKYSYSDYFVVHQKGKYFIQIFDIVNLQQWVALDGFIVFEE